MRTYIPKKIVDLYHRLTAIVADIVYGEPSKRLIVIGVTGTNGKTTTCHMIAELLRANGRRVGYITTVAIGVGGQETVNETKMTSLKNAWQIQKTLAQMIAAGDEIAVVETTSHALDQYRVHRVRYDAGVFLNLSREHLDYHVSMDAYRNAKERLFRVISERKKKIIHGKDIPRVTVTNADDEVAEHFLEYAADLRYAYGYEDKPTSVIDDFYLQPTGMHGDEHGVRFRARGIDIAVGMPGLFTVDNASAALCVALAFGASFRVSCAALAQMSGIPGRMERIDAGQPFIVIVDYAVTPDSFTKLAETIKDMKSSGKKWWWVFGACGDRDQGKRPILGAIAAHHADYVVLTDEDPWSEDSDTILDMVEEGVKKGGGERDKTYWRILDRKKAIAHAFANANEGDIVTITGKGAETSMAKGNEKIPWNERSMVRELAAAYGVNKKHPA
jgi:UDP-N-acetylmuramoyl-L-alanyl-D-glutamate--2,6-diaminopimelate ligase